MAISTNPTVGSGQSSYSESRTIVRGSDAPRTNGLIVNADDWGRDRNTTNRILECALRGAISSASAMVFMSDSERAAELAREQGIDVGLHLNFTETSSVPIGYGRMAEHHGRVAKFLLCNRFSQVVYNPRLTNSFEYLVSAQLEEFRRIYGFDPDRIDGHHHMHLCANVLYGRLLPLGTRARRNFSFWPHEKSLANRLYRDFVDSRLAARHLLADFLFSLTPLDPEARLQRIFKAARESVVELETHPVNADEYAFLTNGEMLRQAGDVLLPGGFAGLRKARSQGC